MTPNINRRTFLQVSSIGAGVAFAVMGQSHRPAASPDPAVTVTDLGVGVTAFSLAGSVMNGDVVYVASRNLDPIQFVGYDLVKRAVVTSVPVPGGISTQALTVGKDGRYVYLGLDGRKNRTLKNLVRVDTTVPGAAREEVGRIGAFNPLHMSTAPDGHVFIVGQDGGQIFEFAPESGVIRLFANADPSAVWGRAVVATDSTVYVSYRGRGADGTGTAAGLYSVDRATGAIASILPSEFAKAPEVKDLSIAGDKLIAIGSAGGGTGIAVIDLADPGQYTFATTQIGAGKLPLLLDGRIYFAGETVSEYDPATGGFRTLDLPKGQYGPIWGLAAHDGHIIVTSAFGLIYDVDPRTSEIIEHDLIAAGAPAGAQLAMSVTASPDYVYVGGNNAIARHDVRTGEVLNLYASGEAKDAAIVDGVLYTGQYSGIGVLRYDPKADGRWPVTATELPSGQNRPQDVEWDAVTQRILIGTQSDTLGGGGLYAFDPADNSVTTQIDKPFGGEQYVRQLTSRDGIAYLGSQHPSGPGGTLLAWDLRARQELWRISPGALSAGITGVAVRGKHLYAVAFGGAFVVIDLTTRAVLHEAQHGDLIPGWGTLFVDCGQVYGASAETFFRFDKQSFQLQTLVGQLGAEWFGMPRFSAGEDHVFYGIRGRNLIRVDVRG